jgi:hypothetical protein
MAIRKKGSSRGLIGQRSRQTLNGWPCFLTAGALTGASSGWGTRQVVRLFVVLSCKNRRNCPTKGIMPEVTSNKYKQTSFNAICINDFAYTLLAEGLQDEVD